MQNRTLGPYLTTINGILISVMEVPKPVDATIVMVHTQLVHRKEAMHTPLGDIDFAKEDWMHVGDVQCLRDADLRMGRRDECAGLIPINSQPEDGMGPQLLGAPAPSLHRI
jgi:hypothetical protein